MTDIILLCAAGCVLAWWMMRTCPQCSGGGFVPIKGGKESKVCPLCKGEGQTAI